MRTTAVGLALAMLLALAACSKDDENPAEPGPETQAGTGSGEPAGDGGGGDAMLLASLRLEHNRAVERIPEFNGVERGDAVLAVKNYRDAVGWVEVNRIERLERLDHTAEGDYVLLVPRFAGSRLTVESTADGALLYEMESTPDDFALIVNVDRTVDGPGLLARLECDAGAGSFDFAAIPAGTALPLLADGSYYTESGHPMELTELARQVGGTATGIMAATGGAGSGETVAFTVTMPDDCALGDSENGAQHFLWRGHELAVRGYLLDGEAADLRAYLGGLEPVEVGGNAALARAAHTADIPAYAFQRGDLVVVIEAPWTVPALDGEWDALALALAESFRVLDRVGE